MRRSANGSCVCEPAELSLPAGALVLAVMGLRLVLRRAPRWTFCLLWGLVALRLISPVSLESSFAWMPAGLGDGTLVEEWTDDYVGDTAMVHDTAPGYDAAAEVGSGPIPAGEGGTYVVTNGEGSGPPDTVESAVVPVLSRIWAAGVIDHGPLCPGEHPGTAAAPGHRHPAGCGHPRRANGSPPPLCWGFSAPPSICPMPSRRRTCPTCWPTSGPTSAAATPGGRPWALPCWRCTGSIPWCGWPMLWPAGTWRPPATRQWCGSWTGRDGGPTPGLCSGAPCPGGAGAVPWPSGRSA